MSSSKKAQVKCPICRKTVDFFSEPLGPFCSNRCQMVDLGKWLGEDYRISEPLRADHFAKYEELTEGMNLDQPDD